MRIEKDQIRTLLAAAGLFALFAGAVLAPLRYQQAQYERRIAEAERTLGIDLKEASGLAKLNEQVTELREAVSGAQQRVPQADELADVLRGLSESLDAFGIADRDVTTRTTQHFADYSVIPIELSFRASHLAAHGVLLQIERMRRLVRVDELTCRGDADDPTQLLDVKLKLSTFIARAHGQEAR